MPGAYSACTLFCGNGGVFPTVFAFVACMEFVQSSNVLGARLILRVCTPKH